MHITFVYAFIYLCCRSAKVGITGFCMGGALAMGGLAKSDDIVCGAPFYGVNFGLFDCSGIKNKPVQVRVFKCMHVYTYTSIDV